MTTEELLKVREEIINAVNVEFDQSKIRAYAEPHLPVDCVIDVNVKGDWKHDHIATTWIMEKHHCEKLSEQNVVSDGSDSYESTHHYIIDID